MSNGEPAGNSTQRIAEASGFRVIHDPKPGIARARQSGLEAAQGDIIVTTDADTLHNPKWLDGIAGIMADSGITCGAGLMQSLSIAASIRAAQAFIAWTMRAKNSINPRLVTAVSEANSFFRRKEALSCGGYDLEVFVGEGIVLFNKMRQPGAPIIFTDPDLVVFTSSRRIEQKGPIRWMAMGAYNTTLHILGRKGVNKDAYPDFR